MYCIPSWFIQCMVWWYSCWWTDKTYLQVFLVAKTSNITPTACKCAKASIIFRRAAAGCRGWTTLLKDLRKGVNDFANRVWGAGGEFSRCWLPNHWGSWILYLQFKLLYLLLQFVVMFVDMKCIGGAQRAAAQPNLISSRSEMPILAPD